MGESNLSPTSGLFRKETLEDAIDYMLYDSRRLGEDGHLMIFNIILLDFHRKELTEFLFYFIFLRIPSIF